jgi:uncharacterized membrane-anchored protein
MTNKNIILIAFGLMVLVQWFVPAKMILDREGIMATGVEYKFKTAPVDPTDPFRGKYITLGFEENIVAVENKDEWQPGEEIYILLTTDAEGFAKPGFGVKEKPFEGQDFVKAKVVYAVVSSENEVRIDYPFERYYMGEWKAEAAEETYREVQLDSTKTTYALVSIQNGEAVLKDVLIDGTPIREIVKTLQEANGN